jgi:hypothetical protein
MYRPAENERSERQKTARMDRRKRNEEAGRKRYVAAGRKTDISNLLPNTFSKPDLYYLIYLFIRSV